VVTSNTLGQSEREKGEKSMVEKKRHRAGANIVMIGKLSKLGKKKKRFGKFRKKRLWRTGSTFADHHKTRL